LRKFNKKIFNSFSDFFASDLIKHLDKDTLCIFDIDGVFFRGIHDPREWLGIIKSETLEKFEELLKTGCSCWIMTNRPSIFKNFPFIRQIRTSIEKITKIFPVVFSGSSKFLKKTSFNYAVIMNAGKPKSMSQKVVEEGSRRFQNVYYIAAPETPLWFCDERLLFELNQYADISNVTLIKIAPWLKI